MTLLFLFGCGRVCQVTYDLKGRGRISNGKWALKGLWAIPQQFFLEK
jgi:hypothetical protein